MRNRFAGHIDVIITALDNDPMSDSNAYKNNEVLVTDLKTRINTWRNRYEN